MRGGARPRTTWHAGLTAPIACHSDSLHEAGEICDDGCNTAVAQWALHARRRNWIEGRIAVCPRLQQIGQIT